MLSHFQSTLRPLVANRKTYRKNTLGESIAEGVKIPFSGAIFVASARDISLFGDIDATEIKSVLYSAESFRDGDEVVDGTLVYRVIASLPVRDMVGKISYYKTPLIKYG